MEIRQVESHPVSRAVVGHRYSTQEKTRGDVKRTDHERADGKDRNRKRIAESAGVLGYRRDGILILMINCTRN
jgi:hypothetical protein